MLIKRKKRTTRGPAQVPTEENNVDSAEPVDDVIEISKETEKSDGGHPVRTVSFSAIFSSKR